MERTRDTGKLATPRGGQASRRWTAAPVACAGYLRRSLPALFELTKPGITGLVLLSAGTGFYLEATAPFPWWRLVHALIGIGAVAAGTNALNEYVERDIDARMRRTASRPLPSGRLQPRIALGFACGISVLGLIYLMVLVNAATAGIVAFTLLSYFFIYTPLKRRTWLSTLVGSVPGALPIMAGWLAAGGAVSPQAWALFAILFLWQLPHFFGLAWLLRDDYARGGFAVLGVLDADGRRTARQTLLYSVLLLPASLLPFVLGLTGRFYLTGALALGLGFLGTGVALRARPTRRAARRVFLSSIAYLPALLLLMWVDKLPR
jgi:heme o synthase